MDDGNLPSGNLTYIAIEHGHLNSGVFPIKMTIFNSYVKLPEGRPTKKTLGNRQIDSSHVSLLASP